MSSKAFAAARLRRTCLRTAVLAVALGGGFGLAACSKTPEDLTASAGAVPGSPQDFAQNVGDRVFFESDSTDLTPRAEETLNKQAAWLQRYDRGAITVEGHADERGTREYNFGLSARRAENTKQYLVTRGIAGSRIRTTSYGKERPVAVCNDISCWSQNRRAVTVIGEEQS